MTLLALSKGSSGRLLVWGLLTYFLCMSVLIYWTSFRPNTASLSPTILYETHAYLGRQIRNPQHNSQPQLHEAILDDGEVSGAKDQSLTGNSGRKGVNSTPESGRKWVNFVEDYYHHQQVVNSLPPKSHRKRNDVKRKSQEKKGTGTKKTEKEAGPDQLSPEKGHHPSRGGVPEHVIRPFPALDSQVLDSGLNCRGLWYGDEQEVGKALGELNGTLAARRPPGFYRDIPKDCARYRQQQGFIETVSPEEREFPLAFSLMVYKEVEQVERLLRAVYRPHNVYCLHVDLKASPQVVQDLQSLTRCLPGVLWCQARENVKWGYFSVLKMELNCMETLWTSGTKWRYLINLTGQEFPLKTNKELVKILKVYKGANDILGEPPKEKYKWRWKKAGIPPPHNITVAKGPVHVAASRGFVDFLLHSRQAQDFLNWTKKTSIPDETFFATINNQHQLGVPGSYTGSLTDRHHIMLNRFKIWDVSNRTCSGQFVRHICQLGPREVSLMTQSHHLVANKFTYDLHPQAWDCMEQWYFRRVRREEVTGKVNVDTGPYKRLLLVQHALRPQHSPWG